jgi:hypothetical protein
MVKSQRPIFKIIDFDYAFKVFPTERSDESYESTKEIVSYWLFSRYMWGHRESLDSSISSESSFGE